MNFDLTENPTAHYNYVIENTSDTFGAVEGLSNLIESENLKFDGILVTAGGWNGKYSSKIKIIVTFVLRSFNCR